MHGDGHDEGLRHCLRVQPLLRRAGFRVAACGRGLPAVALRRVERGVGGRLERVRGQCPGGIVTQMSTQGYRSWLVLGETGPEGTPSSTPAPRPGADLGSRGRCNSCLGRGQCSNFTHASITFGRPGRPSSLGPARWLMKLPCTGRFPRDIYGVLRSLVPHTGLDAARYRVAHEQTSASRPRFRRSARRRNSASRKPRRWAEPPMCDSLGGAAGGSRSAAR